MSAIKQFVNLLRTDLRRAIVSPGFLLGIAATLAIFFYGSQGMICDTVIFSFRNSFDFGNIIKMLFIPGTFAYAASFAEEWQSGYLRPVIMRSNPTHYAFSKCIAVGISGGLLEMLGMLLFIVYLHITIPTVMPEAYRIPVEILAFDEILEANLPAVYFLIYLYIMFLQAMFFSSLGLLASGWMPNKYVAYAAPFVIGTAINKTVNAVGNALYSITEARIIIPNWLDPVKLATCRLYGYTTAKALLVETVAFVSLTAICWALFVWITKRRVANG